MQLIFPKYNCLWDSQVYNDLLRSNPFMTCFMGCCMFSDERMFSEYFLKFLQLNIQFNNNYFKANLVSEWPEQRRLSYFKNIVVRLKVLIADHLFNIFSVIIGFGEKCPILTFKASHMPTVQTFESYTFFIWNILRLRLGCTLWFLIVVGLYCTSKSTTHELMNSYSDLTPFA